MATRNKGDCNGGCGPETSATRKLASSRSQASNGADLRRFANTDLQPPRRATTMFGDGTENSLQPTATGNTLPFAANGIFRLPKHMVDDKPPDEPTLHPSPGMGQAFNAMFAEPTSPSAMLRTNSVTNVQAAVNSHFNRSPATEVMAAQNSIWGKSAKRRTGHLIGNGSILDQLSANPEFQLQVIEAIDLVGTGQGDPNAAALESMIRDSIDAYVTMTRDRFRASSSGRRPIRTVDFYDGPSPLPPDATDEERDVWDDIVKKLMRKN